MTDKKTDKKPARKLVNKGKTCSVRGRDLPSYCKGKCVKHDAQERRKDPVVREKAREASRRSAAMRRAESRYETCVDGLGARVGGGGTNGCPSHRGASQRG